MKPRITPEFIACIPKTDLHVHLDGSLRLATLMELAKTSRMKLPADTPAGLRRTVFKEKYRDLTEYLRGFAYTCGVLQKPANLARVARELAEDNLAEGVRYVEVRFAPQLHVRPGMTIADVVRAVDRGLRQAQQAFNASDAVRTGTDLPFQYGLILCAMRRFVPGMSPYFADFCRVMTHAPDKEVYAAASLELARAAVQLAREENLPVVGFDLAGEESGYPAEYHRAAYAYAHRHFLRQTVHAGEAYGPESIFQAITECYADRIGHGTFLFAPDLIRDPDIRDRRAYVSHLAEYIAARRITIEVCLTSNLQTVPAIRSLAEHPFRRMIARELSVTICTDNRLVSNTTVSKELQLAAHCAGLTPRQFRNVILAGFKGSFFPGPYAAKRQYVRRVIDRYDRLSATLLR